MKTIITKNYKEFSEKTAEILLNEIKNKKTSKIGFAAGKTPLGLYEILKEKSKKGKINFSKIKAFNLDEYYPIKKSCKKSFYYYMQKNIITPMNISKYFLLNGEDNPEEQIKEYKKFIKGTDLIILGVGKNGHIAFNEPFSEVKATSRVVELNEETIKENSGFFSKVPARAITIGIPEILSAKKVILIASGKTKAEMIKELVDGNVNYKYPVTLLRKHKNLIVIVDEESANYINNGD
jgi:glucosamine-6-phosphate deaminase